jgi:hypothetical protein
MNTTKKLMTLLLAVLAMYLLTACDEDVKNDKKENVQKFTSVINNRACRNGVVIFSQSTADVEIKFNGSTRTIKITSTYKDIDGQARTLTTPEMTIPSASGSPVRVYSFSTTQNLGDGAKNLSGNLDTQTRTMRYTFQLDDYTIVCTTHLQFNDVITKIIDPMGASINTNMSAYLFMLNSNANSCVMQISNFIPGVNGAGQADIIEYKNLNVTITDKGYLIKADEAKSTLDDRYYDLTNVDITIDRDCSHFSGSFNTKVSRHEFSGNLF